MNGLGNHFSTTTSSKRNPFTFGLLNEQQNSWRIFSFDRSKQVGLYFMLWIWVIPTRKSLLGSNQYCVRANLRHLPRKWIWTCVTWIRLAETVFFGYNQDDFAIQVPRNRQTSRHDVLRNCASPFVFKKLWPDYSSRWRRVFCSLQSPSRRFRKIPAHRTRGPIPRNGPLQLEITRNSAIAHRR